MSSRFAGLLPFLAATALAQQVKPVAETPVLDAKSQSRLVPVSAEIPDARELYLVVSDEGGLSCDWANWIEPKLVMKDGSVVDLTGLDWKEAKSGYGKTLKGLNQSGKPLSVAGEVHEKGIGTHAPSTITFALPEGVSKFEALAAIDDGGMVRDGKPSTASVRFRVYTQKPPVAAAGGYDPDAPKVVPADLFTVPEGLEVTIWATTPMLHNPTNIDFDKEGRLYVAEGVNYRGKGGRQPEGDRIIILEDTDVSGSADKVS
ncbi:MAG: NPCBM/NEW2 domain-containing protein, partial [Verrucomicrobiae bacterium]|nr:NPCBM/NEW2 domain-containing protein [Verrucomicrobiae bacterium]